jgi:hypothetical protein
MVFRSDHMNKGESGKMESLKLSFFFINKPDETTETLIITSLILPCRID